MGAGQVVNEEVDLGVVPSSDVSRAVIAAGESVGYSVTASGPSQFSLSRQYRPDWVVPVAIVVAVVTLGIGLLLLLAFKKQTETCSVRVIESSHGTSLKVLGVASFELSTALAAIAGRGTAGSPSTPPRGGVTPPPPPPDPTARASTSSFAPIAAVPGVSPSVPASVPVPQAGVPSNPPPAAVSGPAPKRPEPAQVEVQRSVRFGGVSYPIGDGVVVGRNPAAPEVAPAARPVGIADRSLSKTHCVIRVLAGVAQVSDLSSTNGTSVRSGGGVTTCSPGDWVELRPGDEVLAGDQVGVIA